MAKRFLIVTAVVLGILGTSSVVSAVSDMLFPDVEQGSWYEDAANWAGDAGLITGMDGSFVPDGVVTRAQLATIMHRFDNYLMDKYGLEAMEAMEDIMEEDDVMEDDDMMMEYDYTDLTPLEAKDMIDTNVDLIVVDVSPAYDDGHLPGAVSFPLGDGSLDDAIPSWDTAGEYLIYCHSESASREGAQKLVDAGFTNVYRLDGDYGAWVDAGYPVE